MEDAHPWRHIETAPRDAPELALLCWLPHRRGNYVVLRAAWSGEIRDWMDLDHLEPVPLRIVGWTFFPTEMQRLAMMAVR
jgi:hypothetical protein